MKQIFQVGVSSFRKVPEEGNIDAPTTKVQGFAGAFD